MLICVCLWTYDFFTGASSAEITSSAEVSWRDPIKFILFIREDVMKLRKRFYISMYYVN